MFPKFKRGKEPTTSMTEIFLYPRQFRLKGSLFAAKAPRTGCWQRFSEKSSRWPLGSMEVSQDFPGASLVGCSDYFGHTTSKALTKSNLHSES